eukprot:CAMPEP_0197425826 /NCGR_PEP_ID=MMETSP1170-20131217/32562_1 /TAXON_ID=54406 /ORGANISM="Sarcinochrysis sp, Strain CCMP770" /LENGTH=244 /DNA_ID=CAMNT_0042953419 /DNA_START=6 /DNA_END=740 /DNA_ORIENTATION=-
MGPEAGALAALPVQWVCASRDEEAASASDAERRAAKAGRIGKQVARNAALAALFSVPGIVVGATGAVARGGARAVRSEIVARQAARCVVTAIRVDRLFRVNDWGSQDRPMSPLVAVRVVVDGDVVAGPLFSAQTPSLYRAGDTVVFPLDKHRCSVALPPGEDVRLYVEVRDEPELRLVGALRKATASDDPFFVGAAVVAIDDVIQTPGVQTDVNLGLLRGPGFTQDAGLVRIGLEVRILSTCNS